MLLLMLNSQPTQFSTRPSQKQQESDLDAPEEAGAEVKSAEKEAEEFEDADFGGRNVQPLLQHTARMDGASL